MASNAIEFNPQLNVGIQIEAGLNYGGPIFSCRPPVLQRSPLPEVLCSLVLLLWQLRSFSSPMMSVSFQFYSMEVLCSPTLFFPTVQSFIHAWDCKYRMDHKSRFQGVERLRLCSTFSHNCDYWLVGLFVCLFVGRRTSFKNQVWNFSLKTTQTRTRASRVI